jgi:hypothetical protein
MTPFHWSSNETLRRWHHWANYLFKGSVLATFGVIIPLGLWQDWLRKPLAVLGLTLLVLGLAASGICQWCWREAEQRDFDPAEWAREIGWFG